MKKLIVLILAALISGGSLRSESASGALDASVQRLLGRQLSRDLSGAKAKRTLRGTKALWTDIVLQTPADNSAFASLQGDIKNSDMEGPLREAGLKVMDPKKKSLALGLRPTLVLMLLRSPAGADGVESGYYLLIAQAVQDVTPLGGDTFSTPTWIHTGEPIPFSGDDHKDIDAIRASARLAVKAFIDVAKDTEGEK